MMDITVFTQLIGSLGFPIACVCAMFWMWNKEREDHKAEIDQVRIALENNTLALTKIEEILRHANQQ